MTLTDYILEYLKNTFNFDYSNSFIRHTFENFIDYAVVNFNYSENQLAFYLSNIIDQLTFDEIKNVIEEYEKESTKGEENNE